jgi:hypothetical protein
MIPTQKPKPAALSANDAVAIRAGLTHARQQFETITGLCSAAGLVLEGIEDSSAFPSLRALAFAMQDQAEEGRRSVNMAFDALDGLA